MDRDEESRSAFLGHGNTFFPTLFSPEAAAIVDQKRPCKTALREGFKQFSREPMIELVLGDASGTDGTRVELAVANVYGNDKVGGAFGLALPGYGVIDPPGQNEQEYPNDGDQEKGPQDPTSSYFLSRDRTF